MKKDQASTGAPSSISAEQVQELLVALANVFENAQTHAETSDNPIAHEYLSKSEELLDDLQEIQDTVSLRKKYKVLSEAKMYAERAHEEFLKVTVST